MKKRKDGRYVLKKVIKGKTKYIYGDSEYEVYMKLNELLNEKQHPKTFGYYVDGWERLHREEVSTTTWMKSYKPTLDKLQDIMDTPIQELYAPDVQMIINHFANQGYSKKVLSRIRSTISQIIDYAIGTGERLYNFTPSVKIPRSAPENKREALTDEEIGIVLKSGELYPVLLLLTGLRRGEAMALQWRDIDFKSNIINVTHAFEYVGNNPVNKKPKTKSGIRSVPLPDLVKLMMNKGKPEQYVFGEDIPWTQQKNRCYWISFCEKNNINITQHQCRHTYASILAWTDTNVKDSQYVLGHSDFRTTQNIYTHAKQKEQLLPNVAAAINDYVVKR